MNKQVLPGNKKTEVSRPKPTEQVPSVSEILKAIPGTPFVFQLIGDCMAAMPYVSESLPHMTGVHPEEVAEDASPFLARIHPQDIEPFFTSAQASAKAMAPWHQEFRFDHPDKKEIWIKWQAMPVQQNGTLSWHGILLDITEQKNMQWRLELLEGALNQTSDEILLINEELRLVYVNNATCQDLGYSREELLGMSPMDIDPELHPDTASTMMQRLLDNKTLSVETQGLTKSGHLIPVEIRGSRVELNGQRFSLIIARDITERRQMLEELLCSEQAYRNLVENLPDHIARWDTEGRYIYINPALEANIPFSANEVLGKKISDLFPGTFPVVESSVAHIASTGEPVTLKRLVAPGLDGEEQYHDVKLVPEFGDNGQVTGVLGLGRDMTDLYRAQELIAASEREMQFLQRAINTSSDSIFVMDEQFRFVSVNETACRTLEYSRDELVGMTPLDIDPDYTMEKLEKNAQKVNEADSSQAFFIESRQRTKEGRIFPVEIATTPFTEGGQRYAVSVVRDISERKQAEREMTRLRCAVDASVDSIFVINDQHRIVSVNQTACRVLGYSRDELLGMTALDFNPDTTQEELDMLMQHTKVADAKRDICFETRHRTKDGHIFPVEIVSTYFFEDGQAYAIAISRDISERKKAQQALSMSEQAFRSLAESSPDDIIRYDLEHRIRYINDKLMRHLELASAEEVIGHHPREIWPDGRFSALDKAAERAIKTGENTSIEFTSVKTDDSTSYYHILVVPERDGEGHIVGTLAFGRDITALRQNEHRLQCFIDNLPGLAFTFRLTADGQGRFPYLSPRIEEYYGLPPEELQGDMAIIHSHTHHEDRPRIEAAIAEAAQNLSPFHFECRICPPNMPERWLEVRSVPEQQPDGSQLWTGIMLDITERKRASEQLRRREREFRTLAENIPDMVIRYDEKCRRTFVNPTYTRVTGKDSQDPLGKTPLECWLLPTDQQAAAKHQAHLLQVLDSGRPKEWESTWSKADGEMVTLEFRAVPEFGPDGRATSVLAVGRDITTRRSMEQQLRTAASVFDTAKEGIVTTDPRGRIFDTNPAFSSITGFSKEEVLGQRPEMLVQQAENPNLFRKIWLCLRNDGSWSGELVSLRKNGERYYLHLNVMAIHGKSGKPNYYIGIFSDITPLKLHEQQLQHIAYHDALTGLPNRHLLSDCLSQAIGQARDNGKMLAVLYLDLDGFKPVNDNFGHDIGDRVLVKLAHRIAGCLRESDTVARFGGDEFVALLTDISDLRECERAARRLLDSITQPIILDGHRLTLSASIGISRYPDDGCADADILLRYADQAMYLAKAAGRNQFLFYGDDPRSQALSNTQIIHDMRQALDQEQIIVHYQPIVCMVTGQVIKAEALARWKHPTKGMIPPSEFIPAAENSGLIHRIGDLVFEQSARVASIWNKNKSSPLEEPKRIGVNLSPRQFFHRDGVSTWVQQLVERNISGEFMAVEITEGLLLEDRPEVIVQLNQLREMGLSISLDDFGTGYSALSYLKKFDIDCLKIDRSFIRNITDDSNDRAIVEAIIFMAKRLGIKLVAEGVETQAQAALLAGAGCDMAQGFWYAKPMPETEFLTFISQFRGQLP